MNKERFLMILVVLLVLLNAGMLALFMSNKPPHPSHHPKPDGEHNSARLEEEMLHFDDEQEKLLEESKLKHHRAIDSLAVQLRRMSESYYLTVLSPDLTTRDSLLSEINRINNQIYNANMTHFTELKNISKEEQIDDLEKFIKGILRRRAQGDRRKPSRHTDMK